MHSKQNKQEPLVKCKFCSQVESSIRGDVQGYRSDSYYTVLSCAKCGASTAIPTLVDESLYELIYKNINEVPGYSRYNTYLSEISDESDPLSYLENKESAYWACVQFLRAYECSRRRKPKVLEVGCGAGYLTFALRRAGYDAVGFDVSPVAIKKAVEKFGNYYSVVNILSENLESVPKFDAVIMMELVEHVPSPSLLLASCKKFLNDHGQIFLTTPNRNAWSKEHIWETELPPVHLHWLTEGAIQELAAGTGFEVVFTDFSSFHSIHRIARGERSGVNRQPTFSPNGTLLVKETIPKSPGRLREVKRYLPNNILGRVLAGAYCRLLKAAFKGLYWEGSRGLTIAAQLSQKGV